MGRLHLLKEYNIIKSLINIIPWRYCTSCAPGKRVTCTRCKKRWDSCTHLLCSIPESHSTPGMDHEVPN